MGLNIFITLIVLFVLSFGAYLVLHYFKNKNFINILRNVGIFFLSLLLIVFVTLSILPYLMQQKDEALIDEYQRNIETYQQYSEDYADAARQQIEEYQQLQSEMAGRAGIEQLQFWARQEDEVGNALTNKIQEFQNRILDQRLDINAARARIEIRKRNKWFFGL